MTKPLKSRLIAFSAAIAFGAVTLTPISIAEEAHDAIGARKALMNYVGGSMKSLGGMAGGKTELHLGEVKATAGALAAIATAFPAMFPEGSETGGKTTASAAAFSDSDGMKKESMVLGEAAMQLAAATNLEEMQTATRAIGGTCRACHSAYRN